MTVRLDLGGLALVAPPEAAEDAAFIYREIFEQRCYLRHGLALRDGDVIVDAGANLGLFSLFVLRQCRPQRIYAFEPAPPIFACAEQNLQGLPVRLHACGLADGDKELELEYYPNAPSNSTLYARDKQLECEGFSDGFRMRDIWQVSKAHYALFSALYPLRRSLVRAYFDRKFGSALRYRCRLRSLDGVIASEAIERIDLLKVDVEGAEVDLFRGLSDENLRKVQKVVLEVSPKHKRAWLEQLAERLRASGFTRIAVDSVVQGSDPARDIYPCVLFAFREPSGAN